MIPIGKKSLSGLVLIAFITIVTAQSLSPSISQETECDGQNLVTICYTFPCDTGFINIEASTDDGSTWTPIGEDWFATFTDIEGDTGTIYDFGEHCFIWHAHLDLPDYESRSFQVRFTAGCETMRCPRDRNKILIYVTENGDHYGYAEMTGLETNLEDEGYDVTITGRSDFEDIADVITYDIGQLWIVFSEFEDPYTFESSEIYAVLYYVYDCGNLALFPADSPTYTTDANAISTEFDVHFNGDVDHTISHVTFECNDLISLAPHPINASLSNLGFARGESKISYIGTAPAYTPLTLVQRRESGEIMDTAHACLDLGFSRMAFDSDFLFLFYGNLFSCDNELYIHNLASWLAESAPLPGDTITEIATGFVDTSPPTPVLFCIDGVLPGEYSPIAWDSGDMFPWDEDAILSIDDGGVVIPMIVDSNEYMYFIPDGVETVYVQISVRDSFCNWGSDTCSFHICCVPDVHLLCPVSADFSSCMPQPITFVVDTRDCMFEITDLDIDLQRYSIDGSFRHYEYDLSSIHITMDDLGDSALIFVNGYPFSDGDSISVTLESIENIDGCEIEP